MAQYGFSQNILEAVLNEFFVAQPTARQTYQPMPAAMTGKRNYLFTESGKKLRVHHACMINRPPGVQGMQQYCSSNAYTYPSLTVDPLL